MDAKATAVIYLFLLHLNYQVPLIQQYEKIFYFFNCSYKNMTKYATRFELQLETLTEEKKPLYFLKKLLNSHPYFLTISKKEFKVFVV